MLALCKSADERCFIRCSNNLLKVVSRDCKADCSSSEFFSKPHFGIVANCGNGDFAIGDGGVGEIHFWSPFCRSVGCEVSSAFHTLNIHSKYIYVKKKDTKDSDV